MVDLNEDSLSDTMPADKLLSELRTGREQAHQEEAAQNNEELKQTEVMEVAERPSDATVQDAVSVRSFKASQVE